MQDGCVWINEIIQGCQAKVGAALGSMGKCDARYPVEWRQSGERQGRGWGITVIYFSEALSKMKHRLLHIKTKNMEL